jgi:hypothetical protein
MPAPAPSYRHSLKFGLGWLSVFLFRLLPFRPANIEPVLATAMPFARQFGPGAAFLFAFANILVKDLYDQRVGLWTWVTAGLYGLIGIGAHYYLRRQAGRRRYAQYTIVATLVYDAITGVALGPLFFGQSLTLAFLGQIPFTMRHLFGNLFFALVLSPAVEKWITNNARLELPALPARKTLTA